MTDDQKGMVRDCIDKFADARALLHAVTMATSRLDGEDGNAIEKLCDIADDWMVEAMDDLYRIIGSKPPNGRGREAA